jgi:hypothetical protein
MAPPRYVPKPANYTPSQNAEMGVMDRLLQYAQRLPRPNRSAR